MSHKRLSNSDHPLDEIEVCGRSYGKVPLRNPKRWEFNKVRDYMSRMRNGTFGQRSPSFREFIRASRWINVNPTPDIQPSFYNRNGRKRGIKF